jgi:gamma-glutamyltranspeptidase
VSDTIQRGHAVVTAGPFEHAMGHAHAIEVSADGYSAASDPRSDGAAAGF